MRHLPLRTHLDSTPLRRIHRSHEDDVADRRRKAERARDLLPVRWL